MIEVIYNINGTIVRSKGFFPEAVARNGAIAADEVIRQLSYLNSISPKPTGQDDKRMDKSAKEQPPQGSLESDSNKDGGTKAGV